MRDEERSEVLQAVGEFRSEIRSLTEKVDKLDKSVLELQRARWIAMGILAAVGAMGGIVGVKVAAIWHFFIGS